MVHRHAARTAASPLRNTARLVIVFQPLKIPISRTQTKKRRKKKEREREKRRKGNQRTPERQGGRHPPSCLTVFDCVQRPLTVPLSSKLTSFFFFFRLFRRSFIVLASVLALLASPALAGRLVRDMAQPCLFTGPTGNVRRRIRDTFPHSSIMGWP